MKGEVPRLLVDTRDRVIRVEDGIDFLKERIETFTDQCGDCKKKVDDCVTDMAILKNNRHLAWKIGVPVAAFISSVLGAIYGKHFG